MRSWTRADVPSLADLGLGEGELPAVHDVRSDARVVLPATSAGARPSASMYTCGITPYDATHLGHAFTYLAFDTLTRLWLDAGVDVRTAMNSTDVDDPLLERAARDGVDWRELAERQQQLFRDDMEALRILPPDAWVAVTERIAPIAEAVERMLETGDAYRLDAPGAEGDDVLFDTTRARQFAVGAGSRTDAATMLELTREFGGEPDRPGKRSPLDPVLWRAERPGEPAWDSPVGRGRPGWHVECTVIAMDELGAPFTVAAGGRDLRFPHQELQGHHALALGAPLFSQARLNAGLVGYRGEKMSKSLGNLVLVSRLLEQGARPAAVRLALLDHHWREDWEWFDDELEAAEARLDRWLAWSTRPDDDPSLGESVVPWLRVTLADDLNTPAALQAVDAFIGRAPADRGSLAAIDALLGIDLTGVAPR